MLIIISGRFIDMIICKWQQTDRPSINIKRFVNAIERVELQLNDFLIKFRWSIPCLLEGSHEYKYALIGWTTTQLIKRSLMLASKINEKTIKYTVLWSDCSLFLFPCMKQFTKMWWALVIFLAVPVKQTFFANFQLNMSKQNTPNVFNNLPN